MANKTVVVHIPDYAGSTLTIELKNINTGAVLNGTGDSLTEQAEAGTFHATVTEAITGELLVFVKEDSNVIGSGFVLIETDVEGYYPVGSSQSYFNTVPAAVRVELTDELEIINNIPDSFEFVVDQISAIQTVFYISPTFGIIPKTVNGRTLRPYYKDTSRIGPIVILDNNKEEFDLSIYDGDLCVIVEDSDTDEVLLYDADPHYVLHNLYIDPSPESVGVLEAPLCWSLRRISNNQVLMEGPWEVQNAAYGTE